MFLLGATTCLARAQRPVGESRSQLDNPAINSRVETLLAKMTLDEKIGQLSLYSVGTLAGPETHTGSLLDLVAHGNVGSIAGVTSAEQANAMQHLAVDKTRLHIPLLSGTDIDHGDRTIFPMPLALAASFDPQLVERLAHLAAAEARADGIDWTYSPMVDIARDARWGRIVEGSGEDVLLDSTMAAAYVRGYQGNSLSDPASVAACVKHFAAYGAPIAGRDYYAVDMSEWALRRTYLPPYEAALKAGVASVMVSFNSLNGVPMTENKHLLRDILRGEWHFDGLIVSDWGAIGELIPHGVAGNDADAAKLAMSAGMDMDNNGDIYRNELKKLVENGIISRTMLDDAVRHVLRVKFAMGLFEHPYTPNAPPYSATPDKRKAARDAAEETFVLLKNDAEGDGTPLLPLRGDMRSIALIGPLADAQAEMLGSWQGNGNPKDVITLRTALESRLGASGGKLNYAKGTEIQGTSDSGFSAAIHAAQNSDTVVLALGEDGPNMTGEATSRAHIDLPGNQEQLLQAVVATGKPVILVLFNGRPLALPWEAEHVPAILDVWFPGIEAGPAIVKTLFGDSNPSGKLPASFPYSVGQEPLSYAQFPTGRPPIGVDYSHYRLSEKYYSRYIDERNTALFPFGWGLSYSRFWYGQPVAQIDEISAGALEAGHAEVEITVPLRNDGLYPGSEVVQLYVHHRVSSVEEPIRELKAFQRVTLQPGDQQTIRFRLGIKDLAILNDHLKTVVEPGLIDVYLGGSSLADQTTSFKISR
jgi:beta-glucosidase